MRLTKLIICIFIVAGFVVSCQPDRCFHSTGKETTNILSDGYFNRVFVHGMFDIELVQDTTYFVEGVGGSNVIDNIEASVKNDSLCLYNYNSCFWLRDYKRPLLRVHFKDISSFEVLETSYIFSKDPITDDFLMAVKNILAEVDITLNDSNFWFYVHHKSGGKYTFRGKTKYLYLDGYYNAVYDASQLECEQVLVKNHSIADFKVWATNELRAEIYNRGNIYYKGSPAEISDSITSSGKLIPME